MKFITLSVVVFVEVSIVDVRRGVDGLIFVFRLILAHKPTISWKQPSVVAVHNLILPNHAIIAIRFLLSLIKL